MSSGQALHDREAVHDRHVQVEQDDVGQEGAVERLGLGRVTGGVDIAVAGVFEQPLQHEHVAGFVIDDQDPMTGARGIAHDAVSGLASRRSSMTFRNLVRSSGFVT
jgi:hypothetical protein